MSERPHYWNLLTHTKDGTIVRHHPQAITEVGKAQGYVVARVEEWARGDYGNVFAEAPNMLEVIKELLYEIPRSNKVTQKACEVIERAERKLT